jgi:hypothetical protein
MSRPVPPEMLPETSGRPVPEEMLPSLVDKINQINQELQLPEGTVYRQLMKESSLNPKAYNKDSKAAGLAQVIPETQKSLEKRFGRKLDPYNEDDALLMYKEVMQENLRKFKTPHGALRAYNSGWQTAKWDNPETNDYVQTILPKTGQVPPEMLPTKVAKASEFAKKTASSAAKLVDMVGAVGSLPLSYIGGGIAGLTSDKEGIFDAERAKQVKDEIQQRLSLDVQLQKAGLAQENPEALTDIANVFIGKPAEVIANQFADPGTFANDLVRDAAMIGLPLGGLKGIRAFEQARGPVVRTAPLDVTKPRSEPSMGIPEVKAPVPAKTIDGLPVPENILTKEASQKAQFEHIQELSQKTEALLSDTLTKSKQRTAELEGTLAKGEAIAAGGKFPPINRDLYSGTLISDDPLVANLKPGIHDTLSKAAIDFFDKKPELYTPGATVADNMVAAIARGDIGTAELAKYGLDKTELIEAFDKSITQSAQRMAFHSHVTRALNLTREQADFLKSQGYSPDEQVIIQPWLQRADKFRRSMMISQVSTAVGNAISATGRIGIDIMRSPMDAAIQKTFNLPRTVEPLDGLHQFIGIFKQNPQTVQNILKSFPRQNERMFSMFYGDVLDNPRIGNKAVVSTADQIAHVATWANRFQEKMIRSGVFETQLEFELRNRGYDFRKIVHDYNLKDNAFPTFRAHRNDPKFVSDLQDSIKASVDKALDLTYATRPEFGSLPSHLISVINKLPFIATSVIPYPNYIYNALKYTADYNPLGMLQYLSKSERAKFMAGDTSKMSKAITGTVMLGVAMQIVNSEYGQGKFYELTLPDGRRIDLRPYGTLLTTYLFTAAVMKKSKEGTLHTLTSKDVLDGIAGVNFRGGAGLDVVDAFLSDFTNQGASFNEKRDQFAKEYVGNLGSGYFTPFQQLRDVYDQFSEGASTVRDTKVGSPLIDPTVAKLPMLSHSLPPAAIPTMSGPLVIQDPLLKQALSIRMSPKYNDAEKELMKHGFTFANLYPKGLTRELAYEYAIQMGPMVENIIGEVVRGSTYKQSTNAEQALIIDEVLGAMRQPVLMGVIATKPIEEQTKILLNSEPKRIKALLREKGILK